jgi:hypothetical protein
MGAIDNVKEVAKLVKDIGNMDLYRQLLDLQGEIMELTQTNRELQSKVAELQETLVTVGKMVFRSPFYFAEGDNVPHCPRCWEVDRRPVHYPSPFQSMAGPVYTCPQCEKEVIHPRK